MKRIWRRVERDVRAHSTRRGTGLVRIVGPGERHWGRQTVRIKPDAVRAMLRGREKITADHFVRLSVPPKKSSIVQFSVEDVEYIGIVKDIGPSNLATVEVWRQRDVDENFERAWWMFVHRSRPSMMKVPGEQLAVVSFRMKTSDARVVPPKKR